MKKRTRLRCTALRLWAAMLILVQCALLHACGPTDKELEHNAAAALGNDTRLQIAVKDRELTITGVVPDNDTRLQAARAAAATPGVKKIHDRITVKPPPRVYKLPAGTTVRVTMLEPVDSSLNKIGQVFKAALASPLTSGDTVVVPEGTEVLLMLTHARQAGKLTGSSQLEVSLKSLAYRGTTYELRSSTVSESGESRGKQSAKRVGVGTAVGGAIGAVIGKGKGALIGAGAGAAGTTAYQLVTKGKSVRVSALAKLDFTLQNEVTFTLPPE